MAGMITETVAKDSLRSLEWLRQEYRTTKSFSDELEIVNLERGCRTPKVRISKSHDRNIELEMPYDVLSKWVALKLEGIEKEIKSLEKLFKKDENN